MKSLFVYLFPATFSVKCLQASLSKECSRTAQKASATAVWDSERTCFYPRHPVPSSVYGVVNLFAKLLKEIGVIQRGWLPWPVTAVAFLIPVFPRQPAEHQGWPRASPLSMAIMKTWRLGSFWLSKLRGGRNSCKALLNNENTVSISPLTHVEANCQASWMLPSISPAKTFPESKWHPACLVILQPGEKMKFLRRCGFM